MNADLSTLEVLFADMGDMGFLRTLLECPKLQIIGIFVSTYVAIFLASEAPCFFVVGHRSSERVDVDIFCHLKTGQTRSRCEAPPIQDFL
jgi:hypothetical protein